MPSFSKRPTLFACITAVFSAASGQRQSFELTTASIADINAAFDSGTLSSEKLVELCLARIETYDQVGPKLNVVLTPNPRALERARELDIERRQRGPRSPLHGNRSRTFEAGIRWQF